MKARTLCSALFVSFAIIAASAQTADPAKTAQPAQKANPPATQAAPKPARETPADQKAFQDATRILDPTQKIAALEKFKKDFPHSGMVDAATMSIFSTMAQKMPDQKERILQLAGTIYHNAHGKKEKGQVARTLADTLLTNDLLLSDARDYARKSLDAMNQAEFVKDQKAAFKKRSSGSKDERKPPSDADLIKRFQESRATRVATLGRIEFKLGNKTEAQKLLDESYAANPKQPAVAGALGELAEQAGDNAKAMDYLVAARLGGKIPASSMDALNSVYRKTHNGSTDGLEAMLDGEYHKRFPNPLQLEAYKPTEKRSDRLVLAEVFTGSGCPPCVGADLAFEAAMERYSRKDLLVVMYHQHIPQPDPMSNPDAQARSKYYAVGGVPTYMVDGERVDYYGDDRENTKLVWEHIQPPVEKELEVAAEAKLNVRAALTGNTVKVTAAVDGVKSESKELKVHVLLLEKELHYSGENGIRFHPMVVRAMGGKNDDGFSLAPGEAASFEQSWDLDKVSAGLKAHLDDYEAKGHRGNSFKFMEKKYEIDRGNLAIAVFVQDAKTKHVLQSAYIDLNPNSHLPTDNVSGAK
ncbi:MAG TPA: hypothetical protein VLY04_26115 [Bryobacteraceae bacterium]|nr:hypothetical protein [Bryobacteraceae bacterium]